MGIRIEKSVAFSLGNSTVREACDSQGHHQLRNLQVRTSATEGLADDVRPGQDVPPLPQPLEAGDAHVEEAVHVR